MKPSVAAEDMVAIVREGLKLFDPNSSVYIRPMYWAIDGYATSIVPKPDEIWFAICL